MRRHLLIPLMLAGAFAYATACSDAAAPAHAPGPKSSDPPPPPDTSLLLSPFNVSVLTDDSLSVHGFVYPGKRLGTDTLDWSVNDTTIASFEVVGIDRIVIHTRRAGALLVSASRRGAQPLLAASTRVEIFPRSTQPAPIEVVEFYANEYTMPWYPNQWTYTPQLSLRAVGQDSVRILGVTLDLPGSELSPYCWPAGMVRQSAKPMFAPLGYENSVYIAQEDHRTRQGAEAVARINVLLNDGTATQPVVSGPIVSPLNLGDAFSHVYDDADGDWLSCW